MLYTLICRKCQREFSVDDLNKGAPWCAACTPGRRPELEPPTQSQAATRSASDIPEGGQSFSFRVDYQPYPQPRPRVGRIFTGKKCPTCQQCPTKPVIREADDDHPIHGWKLHVRQAWLTVKPAPGWKFEGPIGVQILLVLPRLKSRKGTQRYRPIVGSLLNGDADNYSKGIMDALNSVAWRDDAQVVNLLVDKWAAALGEEPYAVVTIEALDDEPAEAQYTLFAER